MHLKAHKVIMQQGCFSITLLQIGWPIYSKFSQVCYFMLCWDTPSEKTDLWQIRIVFLADFGAVYKNHFIILTWYDNSIRMIPPATEICKYWDADIPRDFLWTGLWLRAPSLSLTVFILKNNNINVTASKTYEKHILLCFFSDLIY